LRQWEASDKRNQAFHAGCCIRTQRLKDMNGYDERYKDGYGYEDWSMLERLKKSTQVVIDKDITTYHIAHPIIRKFHKTIINNEGIYKKDLQDLNLVANSDTGWGNG
jgi:predicted glycosyltransferase involved in capsule biosynthesis